MAEHEALHWQWRALYKTRTGRDSWRKLRWLMTEEEAAAWAANNGRTVQKEPGPPELRCVTDQPGFGLLKPSPKE